MITGASSGIGWAAALAFASVGAHVHLVARRNDRLASLVALCEEAGGSAQAHGLDVTQRDAIFELAKSLDDAGGCDVVIANAGVMTLSPLLEADIDEVRRQFDVNVFGVLNTLQAFGPGMVARGRGVLMPVSSVVSIQSLPHYGAYCGTKFAVRAMADALYMELRGTGVDVVHVLPGATESELHTHMAAGKLPRATRQAKRVPAAHVARAMLKAAHHPRRVVLCDWRARLLYWGQRWLPGTVDWVIGKVTKQG